MTSNALHARTGFYPLNCQQCVCVCVCVCDACVRVRVCVCYVCVRVQSPARMNTNPSTEHYCKLLLSICRTLCRKRVPSLFQRVLNNPCSAVYGSVVPHSVAAVPHSVAAQCCRTVLPHSAPHRSSIHTAPHNICTRSLKVQTSGRFTFCSSRPCGAPTHAASRRPPRCAYNE